MWPLQNWHKPLTWLTARLDVLSWQVCLPLHPQRSDIYSPQLLQVQLIQKFIGQDWWGSEVPKPRANFRVKSEAGLSETSCTHLSLHQNSSTHAAIHPSTITTTRMPLLRMINTCFGPRKGHRGCVCLKYWSLVTSASSTRKNYYRNSMKGKADLWWWKFLTR